MSEVRGADAFAVGDETQHGVGTLVRLALELVLFGEQILQELGQEFYAAIALPRVPGHVQGVQVLPVQKGLVHGGDTVLGEVKELEIWHGVEGLGGDGVEPAVEADSDVL